MKVLIFYVELHQFARCVVFTVVKIQVEVFWLLTWCSVAVGYQRLRRILLPPSSGRSWRNQGSKFLRDDGMLPQSYTTSKARRPLLKTKFNTLTQLLQIMILKLITIIIIHSSLIQRLLTFSAPLPTKFEPCYTINSSLCLTKHHAMNIYLLLN
jgi:hypothetical protein